MSFYSSIADYYKYIFPLNKGQINFIENNINDLSSKKLLDIGCATGHLTYELSAKFKQIEAIDLDSEMIDSAKKNHSAKNINYHKINMLGIDKTFDEELFDVIISFGNTLVHLNDSEEVAGLFNKANSLLNRNGSLLFQIINYDRIIGNNIDSLPTIENDIIRFERNYKLHDSGEYVNFNTILTVKDSGNKIENNQKLLALRSETVKELLERAGYKDINLYSNFKMESFTKDSVPLVVSCRK